MVESLFSYSKGCSFIHKTNPALKLILYTILSISIFSQGFIDREFSVWIKTVVLFSAAAVFLLLAGTPLSRIKNVRFVLVLGFFVTAFRVIQLDITEGKLTAGFDFSQAAEGLLYTARFFTASLLALVFFETTSPLELQESLEFFQNGAAKILPPIKKIPFALYLSLAISFIPEVFSSWQNIKLASHARNPAWKKKKNPISNVRIFFLEFSALLSIMIERAVQKRKALLNRMQYGR